MNITNKYNLPDAFVRAITQKESGRVGTGYASATELLKPIRQFWLTKRHFDELEVDASDQVWSLFGSAIHNILQQGESDKYSDALCLAANKRSRHFSQRRSFLLTRGSSFSQAKGSMMIVFAQ